MTDPYKVLNIKSTATEDEIKAAYKALATKYNPDLYEKDDPFASMAAKKMKEIDSAYDQIMNERRSKSEQNETANQYSSASGTSSSSYSGNVSGVEFSDIRRYINNGQIATAEELLGGIPTTGRTAEWYFLKGCVYYSKGWIEEATNYFGQAVNRDPSNQEYAAAYNQLLFRRRTGVAGMDGVPAGTQCTVCDMCAGMMCMNCLCNGCCR